MLIKFICQLVQTKKKLNSVGSDAIYGLLAYQQQIGIWLCQHLTQVVAAFSPAKVPSEGLHLPGTNHPMS